MLKLALKPLVPLLMMSLVTACSSSKGSSASTGGGRPQAAPQQGQGAPGNNDPNAQTGQNPTLPPKPGTSNGQTTPCPNDPAIPNFNQAPCENNGGSAGNTPATPGNQINPPANNGSGQTNPPANGGNAPSNGASKPAPNNGAATPALPANPNAPNTPAPGNNNANPPANGGSHGNNGNAFGNGNHHNNNNTPVNPPANGGSNHHNNSPVVTNPPVNPHDGENLVYTGAGNDYLREYLTGRLEAVTDAGAKARNQAVASRITDLHVNIDENSGDLIVRVSMKLGKKIEMIELGGSLNENHVAQLRTAKAASVNVRGTLTCLDANKANCFVTHVKLEVGNPGSRGVVHMLHRRTEATFSFTHPDQDSGNVEFERFVDMLENTVQENRAANSMRYLLVDSFEVMNGASGVRLNVITRDYELIALDAPLLAYAGSRDSNVAMVKRADFADLIDLEKGQSFKSMIENSISAAVMTMNDGAQSLTAAITVRGDDNSADQTLPVSFTRIANRLMSLTEVQAIENLDPNQAASPCTPCSAPVHSHPKPVHGPKHAQPVLD